MSVRDYIGLDIEELRKLCDQLARLSRRQGELIAQKDAVIAALRLKGCGAGTVQIFRPKPL